MKTTGMFGAIAAAAVVVVIVMNGPLLLGQSSPAPVGLPTQVSQNVSNGLRLDLSITGSTVGVGQPLVVGVDSFNPGGAYLNVTSDKSWAVQGLRINSCYTSVFPFGIALYQGSYTLGNVSAGKQLQIFPNVPCPLFIRLVTGYYFSPDSSNATVLPGTGPATRMGTTATISGVYTGQNGSAQPLSPGMYTVVAGDEWGTLAFLRFQVP